jgi:FKBP-type peptidyl-prolyl cis-trans isomerase
MFERTSKDSNLMTRNICVVVALGILLTACSKQESTPTATPTAPTSPSAAVSSSAGSTNSETITTASGLKYQVLKRGAGTVSPKASNTVKVHYHGTFLDGTVFDSSVQRGEPATFPLDQVIRGWTEGVQLMKVGDKFKFTIPPELAYGPRGRPGIPPNSTLVFEVELLDIQ